MKKDIRKQIKITNILLFILIDLLLLAFCIFGFFIFKNILIIVPVLFSLIGIYLIIFFLFVLIINPLNDTIIDSFIDTDSLRIIYKDKEETIEYKDIKQYKIHKNRKDEITKLILLMNMNNTLSFKNFSSNKYDEIIAKIEEFNHES